MIYVNVAEYCDWEGETGNFYFQWDKSGTRFDVEGKDEDGMSLDEILIKCTETCGSTIHMCNEDSRGLARIIGVKKDDSKILIVPDSTAMDMLL